MRPYSKVKEAGTDRKNRALRNQLQCHLAELPAPELKMFRDVSCKPGGEPLSQLGYDILT